MKKNTIVILLCCLIFANSCSLFHRDILKFEELFKLKIGKMEDQLNLFQDPTSTISRKDRFIMKDGLFFISNGSSSKIMEFTSYGDIIYMLYNEEKNPVPIVLTKNESEGKVSNRRAFSYPFNDIGEIAVNKDNIVLVDEMVPSERYVYDDKLGIRMDRVILRFGKKGQLLDYIGQEGIGGNPFPYIHRIFINSSNKIIVISRTPVNWNIFYYTWKGELINEISISNNNLPGSDNDDLIVSLDSIFPDPDDDIIYLKLDYYKKNYDDLTKVEVDVSFEKSSIYWYDVNTKKYLSSIGIPRNFKEEVKEGVFQTEKIESLYELLGIAKGGRMFLMSPEENDNNDIIVMDRNGNTIANTKIKMKDSEIFFRQLYLNSQGILSGILAGEYEIKVGWWRTDKLLNEIRDENS